MRAFEEFKPENREFWSLIKYISETLGYTIRKSGVVKSYTFEEIKESLENNSICADDERIQRAADYLNLRASLLNDQVCSNLMNADSARIEYLKLLEIYKENEYSCKIPMNKQSGEMKQVNYFTAMINILTEQTIKGTDTVIGGIGFIDDPRELVYVLDEKRNIKSSTSRRYDGVFPSTINPLIVWEIKEYYYATTFGSRIADGVYETQLDGYEFKDIESDTGHHIEHVFFIDGYKTWWEDGKSYLCRIIDALNKGLVDEVIVGREALTRWPALIKEIINN